MLSYDNSSDKNVGETAMRMVELADTSGDAVQIKYGKDTIVVHVNDDGQTATINWNDEMDIVAYLDSVALLEAVLENSAGGQQNEAGL